MNTTIIKIQHSNLLLQAIIEYNYTLNSLQVMGL